MNRDEILALAADTGAVVYSPPPLRAVRGYSFTYDALEAFYHAAIQHYKDSVLKEVGEPIACVDARDWAWHMENSPETSLGIWTTPDWEKKLNLPNQIPMFFYTSDQLIAARKGLEEEIERLKDEQFKHLEREAEKRMELHQQLKAAQGDITDMRADHLMLVEENHTLREQFATAEQRVAEACASLCDHLQTSQKFGENGYGCEAAIRSGEWRKFVKEV